MSNTKTNSYPRVLSASSICSDDVRNSKGEDLGEIHELMVDLQNGRVVYAVLSFGGFLGMGDKLFAIPFDSLKLDTGNRCFVIDVDKKRLENAHGFDKDKWPDFADESFHAAVYEHWGARAYWMS